MLRDDERRECDDNDNDRRREGPAALSRCLYAEKPAAAGEQASAAGGQDQLAGDDAKFFHRGQGLDVGDAVVADAGGEVVAAVFAFLADALEIHHAAG